MPEPKLPGWLSRIQMLGTTITVLLIGSMVLWYEALEHDWRLVVTIGSAGLAYVGGVLVLGRRSNPDRIGWWPFALAGLGAGAVAELINAEFLVTTELFTACVTGVVIGTAQWAALRVWIHLAGRRPA
jgi:hypothetical protein